jgi:hypothetical protein
MAIRVNNNNRETILRHIRKSLDKISQRKKGFVSIIDLWDLQFEIEKAFGISDYQSQKLTDAVIQSGPTR